jgi:hypothetical protein
VAQSIGVVQDFEFVKAWTVGRGGSVVMRQHVATAALEVLCQVEAGGLLDDPLIGFVSQAQHGDGVVGLGALVDGFQESVFGDFVDLVASEWASTL